MSFKFTPSKPHTEIKKQEEKHSSRSLLHGTGLTKRVIEQAQKDQEKLQAQSFAMKEFSKDELEGIINLNLPHALIDENLILDEFQQAALEGLNSQKFGVMIGEAGTGKTTTVKALVSKLEQGLPLVNLNNYRIASHQTAQEDINIAMCFTSFMGKAVQQIKRALPEKYHNLCTTAHSLLGYCPQEVEFFDEKTQEYKTKKLFKPTFTSLNKLPFKICIIDESGTVPIYLFNELIAALPDDCRIILIGDLNQLPPTTGRSILGFACNKWPVYHLNKIHRQALDNPIIANAHRVIHGKKPVNRDEWKDKFQILTVPDSAYDAFTFSCAVIQKLHKNGIFDPLRDAFIVPQNIDSIGQIAFNEKLTRYFNPTKKLEGVALNPPVIITAGYHHVTFAVGDKVMITSNERDLGLTNGMIGVIKEIKPNVKFRGDNVANQMLKSIGMDNESGGFELDLSNLADELAAQEQEAEKAEDSETERQASHSMTIEFQNKSDEVEFSTAGMFLKLIHSYAMTCHKAQGSEYPTVVILIHSANLKMLTREWLYTAITRARERVILLCNHRGLTHAVNRQLIKGNTLQEKIDKFNKLQSNDDIEKPHLPEPMTI